ncbi:hypothetical protein G6M26_23275 [Agrobacterium tumefaciens]|nr:hypothetical protein [Agrobacterium tumefaciens]NTE21465.1 hypothetical protein [Agrobacterium tumefaciens]
MKIHKTVFQFKSKFMQSLAPSLELYLNEVEMLEKENEELKKTGDIKEMLSQLVESQNSVKEDVGYVKRVYTTPKAKKVSKVAESKLEKKASLRHRILNPGG